MHVKWTDSLDAICQFAIYLTFIAVYLLHKSWALCNSFILPTWNVKQEKTLKNLNYLNCVTIYRMISFVSFFYSNTVSLTLTGFFWNHIFTPNNRFTIKKMKIMCECNEDTAQWVYTYKMCVQARAPHSKWICRRCEWEDSKRKTKITESFSSAHTFNTLLVLVYYVSKLQTLGTFRATIEVKYYVVECDIYVV